MNALTYDSDEKEDLKGMLPESWLCVDCGFNTAQDMLNRIEMEKAIKAAKARGEWGPKPGGDYGIDQEINDKSEVYTVRAAIWQKAGMEDFGGCLCIGCLEKRIGRKLKPKDFLRGHPFNRPQLPGTKRLLERRGRPRLLGAY